MVSKNLFKTKKQPPAAYATNLAGGVAYDTGAEHSLAQYACTGMLGGTYYASDKDELDKVLELAKKVTPLFLAKCAVYSRKKGYMKDMPAVLLAVLSTRDVELFKKTFPLVCDNGKMVKNFVQVMRSGKAGRKSLGSAPKKAIKQWFEKSDNDYLFKQSVGNDPSLADIIKLVHPNPQDKETENLYGYLIGKDYDSRKKYPSLVKEFEAFKKGKPDQRVVPDVPFQMLASSNLSNKEWFKIAENGAWQFTRMNLNNFMKHGLFNDKQMTASIAHKLKDPELVAKSMAFPYQLFQAYRNTRDVPSSISNAIQDALDLSVRNIPSLGDGVLIGVDTSGSMQSAMSKAYSGGTTVSVNEVAALFASAILRTSEDTRVFRFDTSCEEITNKLNSRDSIISNLTKIASNGGGTDCGCFIKKLNDEKAVGDTVILVSDNESWVRSERYFSYGKATSFQAEWEIYKKRNKNAVLICIDLTPGATSQAQGKDVLLVGGFSDNVFNVISKFVESKGDNSFWVKEISESIKL